MNICVMGGGNIGTAIAAYFSQNNHKTIIYSSRHTKFGSQIEAIDREAGEAFVAEVSATNNLKVALNDADLVCITFPSFMLKETFERIGAFLEPAAIVGVIPGTGGVEFLKEIIAGHTIFGMDRVPCISRLKEYGKSVYHSKKAATRIATIPSNQATRICALLSAGLGLECIPLANYLSVTFTPSNPILHTARTYTMFKDYNESVLYDRNFLFYKEWTDDASEVLLAMDDELQQICAALPEIDLSGVINLTTHYEAKTIAELTAKITSITSLAQITSPMKSVDGGYIPDFSSRYFIEDVPYGLVILKGFAQIAGIKTPYMDKVLNWNGEKIGEKYLDDEGNLLADNNAFTPQKFGIKTRQDVYKFYL